MQIAGPLGKWAGSLRAEAEIKPKQIYLYIRTWWWDRSLDFLEREQAHHRSRRSTATLDERVVGTFPNYDDVCFRHIKNYVTFTVEPL